MSELVQMLKAKIHRCTVTQAELDYFGSITVDEVLLKAVNIYEYEKVLVTNMRNGSRIETYALKGEANSGTICLNGPSAHFFSPGDEILIMAFSMVPDEKAASVKPKVVFPNAKNQITEVLEMHER